MRGAVASFAEIDGVRVCLVGGAWCEREHGHEGPHVFRDAGPWTVEESQDTSGKHLDTSAYIGRQ